MPVQDNLLNCAAVGSLGLPGCLGTQLGLDPEIKTESGTVSLETEVGDQSLSLTQESALGQSENYLERGRTSAREVCY